MVEEFFHVGPPLAGLARFERFMAWLADGPPLLRARIFIHQRHVGIEVVADILKAGKQESVFVIDREVANPALGDLGEDLGPGGSVQSFVFLVIFRA